MTTIARLRELVADCNELLDTPSRVSTHWNDCHKSHPYCAIYKLTDALQAMLDVVEAADEMRKDLDDTDHRIKLQSKCPICKRAAIYDAARAKLENNN